MEAMRRGGRERKGEGGERREVREGGERKGQGEKRREEGREERGGKERRGEEEERRRKESRAANGKWDARSQPLLIREVETFHP